MSIRGRVRGPGFPVGSLLILVGVFPVVFAACGDENGDELAAVPLTDGQFGALMASSSGEQLLPIVQRDLAGNPTAVTGALWMDSNGSSMVVEFVPETGLPKKVVFGDYIVLFSNWSDDGTTADAALVYGPTGFIEIRRGLKIRDAEPVEPAQPGMLQSAATCLPNCPSKERTQAEMLKVAGLGLSAVSCGLASAASWGVMLLPCSGAVISGAKLVIPEDSWLNTPLERAGKLLSGIDILQCLGGDLSGCVSAAIDRATGEKEKAAEREEAYQALVEAANDRLMNPAIPSGYQEGAEPECVNFYACTPGLTLNCVSGGTKTCRNDCSWGECPNSGGGGGACAARNDGEAVCMGFVRQVEAQCAASGGRIISWSPDAADCIRAYDCWAGGCPCLFSCSMQCGSDTACVQDCFASSGANAQAEFAACSGCAAPEVYGQCQTQ